MTVKERIARESQGLPGQGIRNTKLHDPRNLLETLELHLQDKASIRIKLRDILDTKHVSLTEKKQAIPPCNVSPCSMQDCSTHSLGKQYSEAPGQTTPPHTHPSKTEKQTANVI
jgi:hypothetical protein